MCVNIVYIPFRREIFGFVFSLTTNKCEFVKENMPTIIALDTSLSMLRNIPGRSEDNSLTYHQLALKGISQLLEHLTSTAKLEYVALLMYNSKCELKVEFTRDYDQVKQAVKKTEHGDKLCFINLIKNIANILCSVWGTQAQNQVVIFTDCGIGFGSTSIRTFLQNYVGKEMDAEYDWLKTIKSVKWNFMCLGVQNDTYFTRAVGVYQQFIDFTSVRGQLFIPKAIKDATDQHDGNSAQETLKPHMVMHKSQLGRTAMFEMVEKLCEQCYKPFEVVLKCGGYFRLESPVLIWPSPASYYCNNDDKYSTPLTLSSKLEICGFMALADIGCPVSLGRHLIMPKIEREKFSRRSSDKIGNIAKLANEKTVGGNRMIADINHPYYEYEKLEQEIRDFYMKDLKESPDDLAQLIDDSSGSGNTSSAGAGTGTGGANPDNNKNIMSSNTGNENQKESICVLLHGALRIENLAALVLLNDNWYGFLYSYADSKKKSNLMLNILPPGNNVIPWLGDLQMLGFHDDLMSGDNASFPVKAEKRSYSQNCVVWINRASLQSDVQKVLRHAKKMPEKMQHFYKELNRIRRSALSIGFVELLEAMATLFDKEAINLASLNANPECILQLKHASIELRKPSNKDLKVSIMPMQGLNPAVPTAAATTTVAVAVSSSSAASGDVHIASSGGFGY